MQQSVQTTLEDIVHPISEALKCFEEEYRLQLQTDADFLQPFLDYIAQKRGKRLRPILFFLSQGLVDRPRSDSVMVAVLIELLHTATLIHDDVVDRSFVRRGRSTLNALWGDRVSVLVGDYLLAKMLALGVGMQNGAVLETVARIVQNISRGELRQTTEGAEENLSVETYLQIVRDKTADLFGAACELGGLMVSASESETDLLRRFGEMYGLVFQIRDDVLDISGSPDVMGKPAGQDVMNGKVTLPLLLALEGRPRAEKQSFFDRLKHDANGNDGWLGEFIREGCGIDRAQKEAENYAKEALKMLESFKSSLYRKSMEKIVIHNLNRPG